MENKINFDLKNTERFKMSKLALTMISNNEAIFVNVTTQTLEPVCAISISKKDFEETGIKVKDIRNADDLLLAIQHVFTHNLTIATLNKMLDMKNDDPRGMLVIDVAICSKAVVAANELYPSKMEKFVNTWRKQLKEENEADE